MKKLFVVMVACTLSSAIFAQTDKDTKMDDMKHSEKMAKGSMKMKDCVMMEDGKMMVMKNGENMAMNEDMTMKNGTTVRKDGTVKMKDGKTMMLKDGDCVFMDGRMSKMKPMKHAGKMKM
jgi:hypothetical protein